MFCYNHSQDAVVAQSVSALCLINLLKTMVVGSSPDDGSFLFCLFYFIFRGKIVAEIIENSHLFSQEKVFCLFYFYPPQKCLVVDVLLKVHNVLLNRHNRSSARFRNSAINLTLV